MIYSENTTTSMSFPWTMSEELTLHLEKIEASSSNNKYNPQTCCISFPSNIKKMNEIVILDLYPILKGELKP